MIADRGLARLEEVLAVLLNANANISATAAAHHPLSPYKHTSDITRNPARVALVKQYAEKQIELRRVMERADKQSKSNLTIRIADLEHKIAQMQAQRDLLIASHKAMIFAVGEMGGMAAWHRFFKSWQEVIISLRDMGAMPTADVLPLAPDGRSRKAKTNG